MALELRDIHKRYGKVRANDGIDLVVEEGTLHGLLGENGAGKSTLMKVLSGYIAADSGAIILDGERLDLTSPRDAITAGIGMLHQDPLVFLPFTVLDNFLLGSPGSVKLDRTGGAAELERQSTELGFSFEPDRLARSLTVGERQQLEITRLIWLGARVLIFDEPTTGISATQRDQLFATLRQLAAEGMIVIFVSHKLEEVEELCDSVTVIRQGKVVGEVDMPVDPDRLVELMFGKVIAQPEKPLLDLGKPMLTLDGVDIKEGTTLVESLDLVVAAGEVVGLAGLEGSGQRPLLQTCAGLLKPTAGTLRVAGSDLTQAGYREHLAAGIHYLPAGRLEEGLVGGLTIEDHFVLTGESQRLIIDRPAAEDIAVDKIDEYHIKGSPGSTAASLSGGNQQRLLLAMLPDTLKVLLMEHPTRGLDVESADYIWARLLERRTQGTSIVFASADLDELLRYSDRIVVLFAGDVFATVDAASTSGDELGHLIGGRRR